MLDLKNTTALILAGGLGTRLKSVIADRPKVIAEVRGRPFLARLLNQLADAGVRADLAKAVQEMKKIVAGR